MGNSIATETRLNVRVKGYMAQYVESLTGDNGLYENQSEYLRDLIRRDMETRQPLPNHPPVAFMRQEIIKSYADIATGHFSEETTEAIFEDSFKDLKSKNL